MARTHWVQSRPADNGDRAEIPYMNSSGPCTVCRTTMELTDRQPVDEQYEVWFFKCPLCSKAAQTVTYSKLLAVIEDPVA
jgi:flavoprotein